MIDGIPNRPLYFYQKDIIGGHALIHQTKFWSNPQIPRNLHFRGHFPLQGGAPPVISGL